MFKNKSLHHVVTAALLIMTAACSDSSYEQVTATPEVPLASRSVNNNGALVAPLDGSQEVPVVVTNARGNAVFKIARDGQSVDYRVIVAGAQPLLAGHVHLAPAGTNGPFVAFLFNFAPLNSTTGVSRNGVISNGTITEKDLIVRLGFSGTMDEFIAALRNGGAYVNIHTVGNASGEVRGQIKDHSGSH